MRYQMYICMYRCTPLKGICKVPSFPTVPSAMVPSELVYDLGTRMGY